MEAKWYICPYDVSKPYPGLDTLLRVCAMSRHIRVIPNVDGFLWAEAEILSIHTVAKVKASAARHVQIGGDPDFLLIPKDLTTMTQVMKTKLTSLGYTTAETDAIENISDLLLIGTNAWKVNSAKDGFDILGRVPGKTTTKAILDAAVPD